MKNKHKKNYGIFLYFLCLPAEEYDTEVYADTAFGFNKAGHFLYRKNYNEEKSIYDLYMDKALVDYDVHSCTSQNDGTLILFTTDYDSDSGSYMLNRFAGGEKAKVAESVCDYDIWDDGTLLYLCNPSSNKKYDLYISKDGTNTNVDFDVLNFVDNVMSTTYGIFTLRWNVGDD